MPITRVQGLKRGIAGNSNSLTLTLDNTPTSGNVLVAVIGTYGSYPPLVQSISQQSGSVTWTQRAYRSTYILYGRRVEIWTGVVSGTVSRTLTITLAPSDVNGSAYADPVIADVCEYSGLNTGSLYDTSNGADSVGVYKTRSLATGTIASTSQANELWIGGIFNVSDLNKGDTDTSPTNGFTMLDGAGNQFGGQDKSLAYLEKIVWSTGSASCSVTGGDATTYSGFVGCIVALKGSTGSTIVVPRNGRYSGDGSKQNTVTYTGASTIMQVEANVPGSYFSDNAVIENLIIDGQSQSGTVGILLQNVYNCTIRNLTILNCDVGIKIENTNSYWSQANRIEHIRMTNVKQGILFTGTSTGTDFGFTIIEDVGIKLADNYSSGVGIQIGVSEGPIVKPYNSFIKATVWLGNTGGYAMRIYGEVKYSLAIVEVEPPSGNTTGKGIDIQTNQDYAVYNNQSFMLTHGSLSSIVNQQYYTHNDIFTRPL